jgi:hypothetical protein
MEVGRDLPNLDDDLWVSGAGEGEVLGGVDLAIEVRQSGVGDMEASSCWLGLFSFCGSFSADRGLGDPHWEMNDSTRRTKLARGERRLSGKLQM